MYTHTHTHTHTRFVAYSSFACLAYIAYRMILGICSFSFLFRRLVASRRIDSYRGLIKTILSRILYNYGSRFQRLALWNYQSDRDDQPILLFIVILACRMASGLQSLYILLSYFLTLQLNPYCLHLMELIYPVLCRIILWSYNLHLIHLGALVNLAVFSQALKVKSKTRKKRNLSSTRFWYCPFFGFALLLILLFFLSF